MIINHNISALNTYRQLTVNNNASSKSLEKLSSGYRINRAGDDAAGLAISEKMRGQIRGLNMASKNAQDGISLIQTAEGALNETHSILQRMRELAVQASNGTNTNEDRAELQKEIEQLKSEINRISTDTEFNTKKLLDGSISNNAKLDDTNKAKLLDVKVVNDNISAGDYTISISKVDDTTVLIEPKLDTTNETKANGVELSASGNPLGVGKYTLVLTARSGEPNDYDVVLKDATGKVVASRSDVNITNAGGGATLDIGGLKFTWDDNSSSGGGNDTSTVSAGSTEVIISANFIVTVADADGKQVDSKTVSGNTTGTVNVGGLAISFNTSLTNDESKATVETDAVSFQIGANAGQYTKLSISDMSSKALGVDGIDLSTAESASEAITTIDQAIQSVSSERAKLGAIQNRLEHTINNLGTSAENLTAAESRIRDVDMAKEMMEFTKNSILQQAAQAMLAQANQMPQGVLQLLR